MGENRRVFDNCRCNNAAPRGTRCTHYRSLIICRSCVVYNSCAVVDFPHPPTRRGRRKSCTCVSKAASKPGKKIPSKSPRDVFRSRARSAVPCQCVGFELYLIAEWSIDRFDAVRLNWLPNLGASQSIF